MSKAEKDDDLDNVLNEVCNILNSETDESMVEEERIIAEIDSKYPPHGDDDIVSYNLINKTKEWFGVPSPDLGNPEFIENGLSPIEGSSTPLDKPEFVDLTKEDDERFKDKN